MKHVLKSTDVDKLYKNPVAGNYSDGDYLYLVVSEKGVLSFRYRVNLGNVKNWITIGRYPAVTLAYARDKALEYSKLIAQGINPKDYIERQKALSITIAKLAEEYIEHQAPLVRKNKSSLAQLVRCINSEIVAKIGTIKLSDLTSEIIHKKLIQPKIKISPAAVKRNIITLKQVIKYAYEIGYINTNPVDRINVGTLYQDRVRERVLSDIEISLLLNTTYKANIRTQWKIAVHLLLILLVRKNELLQATWDQVDFENKLFHIPINKTNKPTKVPLSESALKLFGILKELNGECESVFTGKTGKSPCHNTLNNMIRFTETVLEEPFTIHDLRRTGATKLQELGFDMIVIEAALNHEFRNKSGLSYFKHDYLDERRKMLEVWSIKVEALIPEYNNYLSTVY
ncbi:tyrosine-type recombinase/integrase [Aquella oligotrophica]|uniref:Integrase n=1 Tax=Aquella oligotrophica TaxID=2067065 RepID=A0A2I7N502_9NEIS|nr:site-specific integrase [Aquella oligotrophica]AUR51547.1 hypothetical protein CUN60_04330 [Aquella oligotrophica]